MADFHSQGHSDRKVDRRHKRDHTLDDISRNDVHIGLTRLIISWRTIPSVFHGMLQDGIWRREGEEGDGKSWWLSSPPKVQIGGGRRWSWWRGFVSSLRQPQLAWKILSSPHYVISGRTFCRWLEYHQTRGFPVQKRIENKQKWLTSNHDAINKWVDTRR